MFRPLRRFRQALSPEECAALLCQERRGVLSVLGDEGYPYGVPMNFWYDQANGLICFHGAKEGHKQDALARLDKASFCVYDQGVRQGDDWPLHVKSVVVFGQVRVVEDQARAMEICRQLCHRFTNDEEYIQREIQQAGPRVRCLELVIQHISGKAVIES